MLLVVTITDSAEVVPHRFKGSLVVLFGTGYCLWGVVQVQNASYKR